MLRRKHAANLAVMVAACGHVEISAIAAKHRPQENLIVLCPRKDDEEPKDALREIMATVIDIKPLAHEVLNNSVFSDRPFWENRPERKGSKGFPRRQAKHQTIRKTGMRRT